MPNSTEHEILLRFSCIHHASSPCIHHAFVVFSMLINVKMPTIVGILTFMSMMNTTFETLKVRKSLFSRTLKFNAQLLNVQATKIFQYCSCPAGRVTYNFHLSCKRKHLPFESVCNKGNKGVMCNMTSLSNSSQSRITHPF